MKNRYKVQVEVEYFDEDGYDGCEVEVVEVEAADKRDVYRQLERMFEEGIIVSLRILEEMK